jgi:hypothetical protein
MLNPIMVMSRAVAPVAVSLTRTTLGRLYAGGATAIANVRPAFSASDWIVDGNSPSVSVSSNNLVVGVGTSNGRAYASCTAVASRSDVYVQANWIQLLRTNDTPGLIARYQNNAGQDFVAYTRWSSNQQRSYEQAAGVTVINTTVTPEFTRPSRLHMRLSGSELAGKVFATNFQVPLSGVGGSAGSTGIIFWNNNGIQSNGQAIFDEYYATRSHILTVTSSLSAGWYVVLVNASNAALATSDNAVAGTATIDMYQLQVTLPLAVKIEIREFATGNLLISDTPIETVWPGDEWTFTPAGGYTPPIIVSRLSKSVSGKLFSHANVSIGIWNVADRFVATDWTGFSGTGTVTPSVPSSGNLQLVTNLGSGARGARYSVATVPQNHFAIVGRVSQTTGGSSGVMGRINSASPTQNYVASSVPFGFSGTYALTELLAGAIASQDVSVAANRTISAASLHSQWVRGLLATGRQTSVSGTGPADSTLNLAALNAATTGQQAGVWSSTSNANTFTFQLFTVSRSAVITITGPNSGTWQVRLRNVSGTVIYTSASHTGGVVEINTQTELTTLYSSAGMPLMSQIEIFDPGTATVIRGPESPVGYVWGGDEWTWN